tara:strand:- start:1223 stop:1612 length:390 start_codon:yes stop_codon:yes gene_type:complete
MEIKNIVDLNRFKSAPILNNDQKKIFLGEIDHKILQSDWITIGIMALDDHIAIKTLKTISSRYSSIKFNGLSSLAANGSVFLKGNQKTGNVYIRSENGLGEGILLTCQYDSETSESTTYGPFPLDFFIN